LAVEVRSRKKVGFKQYKNFGRTILLRNSGYSNQNKFGCAIFVIKIKHLVGLYICQMFGGHNQIFGYYNQTFSRVYAVQCRVLSITRCKYITVELKTFNVVGGFQLETAGFVRELVLLRDNKLEFSNGVVCSREELDQLLFVLCTSD